LSQSVLGGVLALLPAVTTLHLHLVDHARHWGCNDTTPYADLEGILDLAYHDKLLRSHIFGEYILHAAGVEVDRWNGSSAASALLASPRHFSSTVPR
jgi:hypothetical protein